MLFPGVQAVTEDSAGAGIDEFTLIALDENQYNPTAPTHPAAPLDF